MLRSVTPPQSRTASPRVYLLVMRHLIVAQDLAEIIRESEPEAEVLLAATASAALETLSDVRTISVAFITTGPDEFAASALKAAIAAREGRVVLMGDAAERYGENDSFAILAQPFLPAKVTSLLMRMKTMG